MKSLDKIEGMQKGVRVGHLISLLERLMRQQIGTALESLDITLQQYITLLLLSSRGPISNADLARAALITPQSANKLVKQLAEKEYVELRPNPSHGRILLIHLAALGLTVLEQADKVVMDVEGQLLGGFSPTEQKQFQAFLLQGIEAINAP